MAVPPAELSAPRPAGDARTRTIDTRLVAAAAAWLIFNSHLESYWPKHWLAADGLLGNTLFLVLSGYGVQMSLLGRAQRFGPYAWRRITRIYPAVIIAVLCFEVIFDGHWKDYGPREYVRRFLWPTPFTYVEFIMPLYVVLYFVGRLRSKTAMLGSIVVAAIIYLGLAFTHGETDATGWHRHVTSLLYWARWPHYWIATAVGAFLALAGASSSFTPIRVALFFVSALLYFGIRFTLIVLHQSELLTIPVDVLVITTSAFALLAWGETTFVKRVLSWPLVGPILLLSAACTLESFVVGQSFTERSAFVGLRFPLNIIALAVLSFGLAGVLHLVCEWIRRRLEPGRPVSNLPVTPSTSNPPKEEAP